MFILRGGVFNEFKRQGSHRHWRGSRGLGRGMALALAEAGADVVVASRTLSALKEVSQEIKDKRRRALPIELDVCNLSSISRMVDKVLDEFGKIDILVNNAGMNIRKLTIEVTEEGWNKIVNTNSMENAPEIAIEYQNWAALFDSLVQCEYMIFGVGALKNVGDELKSFNQEKILLLTDKVIRETEPAKEFISTLSSDGFEVKVFESETKEPTIGMVNRTVDFVRSEKEGIVIGMGGGSVMDQAKIASALAKNESNENKL